MQSAQSEADNVGEHLRKTMTRLIEAEASSKMFSIMLKRNIATNDVRNFARKQAGHKKADKRMNKWIIRTAMKSKLVDA